MYEATRGHGRGGRLLLPDLVANAADDSDGDSSSSSDGGGLFLVQSRLAFRAMLERERSRDLRVQVGFPADRGSFASSFARIMGTLYADVADAARVAFPRDVGVVLRVYCDDHALYIGARGSLPVLSSIPEAGWVERHWRSLGPNFIGSSSF